MNDLLVKFCLLIGLILCLHGANAAQEVEVEQGAAGGGVGDSTNIVLSVAGVSVPLNKRVRLNFIGVYGNKIRIKSASVELPITLNKYLAVAPGVARVAVTPPGRTTTEFNRVQLSATATIPLKPFTIENRSRAEYLLFAGSRPDETRFSNRARVAAAVKIKGFAFSPFAYVEPTYNWRENGWTRQRYAAGVRKTFVEKIIVEMSYLRQNDRGRNPLNAFVVTFFARL